MTNVTTITTPDGDVTINSELFTGYNQEAQILLRKINNLQEEFKLVVEAVADATKMKKAKVSKYYKERFKDSTKETSATGELFAKLDEILN